MDGGEEYAAAGAPFEQFAQLGAAFHADNVVVADVAFGFDELPGKLVVEVGAVGNQHDGGAGEFHTAHQQAGEEQHGVALAATRRAEIRAAFAVAVWFTVCEDVGVKLGGGVILRVTAHYFVFLAGSIRQVDEVADHVTQAAFVEQALDQGVQRVDAIHRQTFITRDLAPCVEKFVAGEQRTDFAVYPVGDHAQRVVFEQFGNVAAVAGGELHVSVVDGGFFAYRAFEFKHHQRQAVDVKDRVGNAFFVAFDFELVDQLVAVFAGTVARLETFRNRHFLA